MKYTRLLFVAFLISNSICMSNKAQSSQQYTYQLQFSPKKIAPQILHKGVLLKAHDGSVLFQDVKRSNFTIAVTTAKIAITGKNDGLTVAPGQPYALYTCQKTMCRKTKDTAYYCWTITEEQDIGSARLPKDALILIIDPATIKTITSPEWAKESVVIPLPSITLTEKAQQECIKSSLASIDTRAFHEKISDTTKYEGKVRSTQRIIT